MERWKDVIGYEGLYKVSSLGQIKRVRRQGTDGRVLSLNLNKKTGYISAMLYNNGESKRITVHRLVLIAFVGPCPDGQEGCHNDGVRTNNILHNLRWDTRSSNHKDKSRHGTHYKGHAVSVVRSDGKEYASLASAAVDTGCYASNIWRACNDKTKSSGGHGWRYQIAS